MAEKFVRMLRVGGQPMVIYNNGLEHFPFEFKFRHPELNSSTTYFASGHRKLSDWVRDPTSSRSIRAAIIRGTIFAASADECLRQNPKTKQVPFHLRFAELKRRQRTRHRFFLS